LGSYARYYRRRAGWVKWLKNAGADEKVRRAECIHVKGYWDEKLSASETSLLLLLSLYSGDFMTWLSSFSSVPLLLGGWPVRSIRS
jgi:hypothetical protein